MSLFSCVLALDFVQFVDLEREPDYDHDEAMAMSNADRTRGTYDASANSQAGYEQNEDTEAAGARGNYFQQYGQTGHADVAHRAAKA